MSDPVTNVEIEDVLTSIRRLVSSSAIPGQQSAKLSKRGDFPEQDRSMDKLVLTQALRIPEPDDSDLDSSLGEGDDILTGAAADAPAELPEPTAKTVAPFKVSPDAPRPHVADVSTLSEVEALAQRLSALSDATAKEAVLDELRIALFDRAGATKPAPVEEPEVEEAVAEEQPEDEVAEDTAADEAPADEDQSPVALAKTLEQKIAELEAMIGQSHQDFESEVGDPAPAETVAMTVAWDDATVAPEADEADESVADEPVAEAPMAENVEPEPEDEPKAKAKPVNEPHILFAHRMTPSKPVEADEGDKAEETPAAPEEVAQEAPKAAETRAERFPPLRAVPSVASTASIDDGQLRDLITTILQEELRGDLGERITRNVRKMVRREIQRALMARELE